MNLNRKLSKTQKKEDQYRIQKRYGRIAILLYGNTRGGATNKIACT